MKHQVTKNLYNYWDTLRARRPAPMRQEIEPSDIRHILGDTFILEAVDPTTYNFRLAGTRMCSAYCRELKGRNFLSLWTDKDHEAMTTLLAAITQDAAAAVVGVEGVSERGQTLSAEVLLLPLAQPGSFCSRVLGSFVSMERPYWIGIHPLTKQAISSMRLIWPDERPHFLRTNDQDDDLVFHDAPDETDTRRVRHLVVYDGGKADGV